MRMCHSVPRFVARLSFKSLNLHSAIVNTYVAEANSLSLPLPSTHPVYALPHSRDDGNNHHLSVVSLLSQRERRKIPVRQ